MLTCSMTSLLSLCVIDLFSSQANVMASYHVGEGINTLHKVSLIPGGSEVLVYTTLSGSIGILVPFSSKEVIKYLK